MKKLVFYVRKKKEVDFKSIVKNNEMFAGRISYDEEQSCVIAESVTDIMDSSVRKFVQKYFNVSKVDVFYENKLADQKIKMIEPDVFTPSKYDTPDEKELIKMLNKLQRTAKGIMYKKEIDVQRLARYIYTCITEMNMKFFGNNNLPQFSVGDVVECYLGYHLQGEVEGVYVKCIICDIINNNMSDLNFLEDCMAYVIPISQKNIFSKTFLKFNAFEDVEKDDNFKNYEGYALLDKGRYICVDRIGSVAYRLTEKYFSEVLSKLPSAYAFPKYPSIIEVEECGDEWLEKASKTVNKTEKILLELVGAELAKLNKCIPLEDRAEDFACNIGMRISDRLLIQAFITSCMVDEVSYKTLVPKLQEWDPALTEYEIKTELRDSFKTWLSKKHPDVATNCSNMSILTLFKIFAKRCK